MALAAASETKRLSRGNALSGYRSDGRSLLEGNPVDGRPGPYADEHTRNVVGLSLVQRGDVPTRIASRTGPELITSRNAAGTLRCQTGSGRREQLLSSFVYLSGNCLTPRSNIGRCILRSTQKNRLPSICCIGGCLRQRCVTVTQTH